MSKTPYVCLWFDGQAKKAVDFYKSIFKLLVITGETPLVVNFEVEGSKLMALDGGPMFKITPSISLFITCETDEEVDYYYNNLSKGGTEYIPLGKYDWSERYGWCGDPFGVTWQIYKGKMDEVNQKIVPMLLFTDKQFGRCEEAVKYYTSLVENSAIEGILKYGKESNQLEGAVLHSQFRLNKGVFMAMDGPGEHNYTFNEAVSLVVECENQQEIDYYWNTITSEGKESMCGWCCDKFGVWWQIVPAILPQLLSDPSTSQRVTDAFLKMKKFDIEKLLE